METSFLLTLVFSHVLTLCCGWCQILDSVCCQLIAFCTICCHEACSVFQEILSSGSIIQSQFIEQNIPQILNFLFKVQLFGVELSDGGNIVDLTHIAPNTLDFISAGDSARNVASQYLSNNPPSIARTDVKLAAPINRMDKVLVNWPQHLSMTIDIVRFSALV